MPRFQKLSAAEVESLRRRRVSKQDLSDYLTFLDTFQSGEWGSVSLQEGESQRAIKRRLTVAAKQQGKQIRYKKGEEGRIVFEVR